VLLITDLNFLHCLIFSFSTSLKTIWVSQVRMGCITIFLMKINEFFAHDCSLNSMGFRDEVAKCRISVYA
jgi:hypothetical protein